MKTLTVILPVYNEAETIQEVIDRILDVDLRSVGLELLIVESHSTDGTRALVAKYESDPRVRVLYEDRPHGKGHAVRAGFDHARGDVILIQDGDLEYRVDDYPALLEPILSGEADFVLGCRHTPGQPIRVFETNRSISGVLNLAHWVFAGLFNLVYGTSLRDPFTMYKVFNRKCIEGLEFRSDRFDFDWELVAKLVRRGYQPLEIPVWYESRGFADGKKVRFFRDPLTWMIALVRFRFVRVPRPAVQEWGPEAASDVATPLRPTAGASPEGL